MNLFRQLAALTRYRSARSIIAFKLIIEDGATMFGFTELAMR
ncbi:hypothetical protein ACOBV9_22445 (plasmid) [Pseudoalteromonas espejiana]